MENKKPDCSGLLNELKRLEKAVETGDFKVSLFEGEMTEDEEQAVKIINNYLSKYHKAVEYDIMKYKLTSDALNIALWDMDIVVEDPVSPNNKFTWSKEFRKMLGFTDTNDFPDLLCSWSNRLHPDDKERTLEAFATHITDLTGKTPYDIEYRLQMKTGEYRYFHAYGNTLRSRSGIPLRVAGALMDITVKIDMATALNEALAEARSANNAKSEFLANMSHEMRTPLNAVIGLTGLSLENENLDNETQRNLEKVHNAGTILLNTVNDILDISKIESGKLELVPVEYCVPSLINDTVTQNLLRIGEKSIEMKLDICPELYAGLYGDELRVRQIINNLLSNAVKYTNKGQVKLIISCKRENKTAILTIQVEDTGRGIQKSDLDKLFTDYTQFDMQANRQIEGTGLGLSITKRLCELMDGTISAVSEYGTGSTFTAVIKQKIVNDEVISAEIIENLNTFRYFDEKRAREKKIERLHLPYAHVLVVDDNLTNLDVAKGLMKPYGMKIACVDSGQKAIDAIKATDGRFCAVFMDQMMPGMDGIEALVRIRDLGTEYAKNIPIIALTANAIVGNEEYFLNKGFQAFLSKPIDIFRLDAVIRQWIRDKDREHEIITPENRKPERSLLHGKKVEGLKIQKGLKRFGDHEDSYLEILRAYTVNTKKILPILTDFNKKDIKNYEITIHGIKGSNYSICADDQGDEAKKLEFAAKENNIKYIEKNNPKFIASTEVFIEKLEELLDTINSERPEIPKEKSEEKTLIKPKNTDRKNLTDITEKLNALR